MTTRQDLERTIEFEFVRATENAALNTIKWLGRGEKELADAAACDAIYGVFDTVPMRGAVMIGEGIKDNAPGIFLGEQLGTWAPDTPCFDIALDPIDGTTNVGKGLPNAISVISASQRHDPEVPAMINIPAFYVEKLAYGPPVVAAMRQHPSHPVHLAAPVGPLLDFVARALRKRVPELVVATIDRPRSAPLIAAVRRAGAALRMIADGDVTAAVAPALADSGVDLFHGIGGAPEGILAASALKCLGGDLQLRMWFKDERQRAATAGAVAARDLRRIFLARDLVPGAGAIFCATGITDSAMLPGVKLIGETAITHSILMRAKSRTVRYIKAVHNLKAKTIRLRSDATFHTVI
ncbi:MAG: fructose-bisphosphatase class II family protein [Verrucomicrobiales bacterium]|jgi:fructose-1,6-bisphosphatase II|nr:fructose-bisphosphatase class II family protein [Verrucomicrobiales bacterium]